MSSIRSSSGVTIHLLLPCAACWLIYSSLASGAAITVHTARELREAISLATKHGITVMVDADRIELAGKGLYIWPTQHPVDLVGVPRPDGSRPVIDFQMIWDGDWENNDKPANGIAFNCASAWVRGLTFTGYEWKGGVLKFSGTGLFHVQDCHFEKLKLRSYLPRTHPESPKTSADAWTGSIIVGAANAHMVVDACTFIECVQADAWGHCIYAFNNTKSLTVTNCTFIRCGSVHRSQPEIMRCFGNTYKESAQTVSSKQGGERVWTFAYYPRYDNSVTAMFERFINATYRWPIRSTALPERHVFDHNDYSGLHIVNEAQNKKTWKPYSSLSGDDYQPAMEFGQWQRAGFDRHSKPPAVEPSGSQRDASSTRGAP